MRILVLTLFLVLSINTIIVFAESENFLLECNGVQVRESANYRNSGNSNNFNNIYRITIKKDKTIIEQLDDDNNFKDFASNIKLDEIIIYECFSNDTTIGCNLVFGNKDEDIGGEKSIKIDRENGNVKSKYYFQGIKSVSPIFSLSSEGICKKINKIIPKTKVKTKF